MRLSPWPRARRWQLSAVRDRASAHSSVVLCVWVSRFSHGVRGRARPTTTGTRRRKTATISGERGAVALEFIQNKPRYMNSKTQASGVTKYPQLVCSDHGPHALLRGKGTLTRG
jgi:hypothetical protein